MNNDSFLIPIIPFHEQIVKKGKGSYIYATNGNKYLDLNSGQFCTIFGHANDYVVKKVTEISNTIVHTSSGMISESVINTSKKYMPLVGN